MVYDLIIIGLGPSGLSAGLYAGRYKLKTLLIGANFGGAMAEAWKIENYPGFLEISGLQLAKKMREQVERLGVEIQEAEVTKIQNSKFKNQNDKSKFEVITREGKKFESKALILALGTQRRKLNVPGEEKFHGKGVSYCATCLPSGEEVVVNDSLQKIQEIGIGQKVLTIKGSFQNINQIISHDYKGEIIKIKVRFFPEPVRLTSNHRVFYSEVKRNYNRELNKEFVEITKPKWKEAGQLTNQDVLLYPIISKTKDVEKIRLSKILNAEVKNGKIKNYQETHTSHRICNEIPVDEKFLRLAGYYLAEGSLGKQHLMFYFNKNEKRYIDEVKNLVEDLFHLKSHLQKRDGLIKIEISSKILRDLFQVLFGKNAPNKKIPHWMLFLPLKKQKEIIKGVYRGDGCPGDKDFRIVTSSRTLTYQLRDILLRLKIIPSIEKREKAKLNKIPGEIGGRKIRFNTDKYYIRVGGPSLKKMSEILGLHHPFLERRRKSCRDAWIKNNYLYLPIREIKREDYKGRVYNLAVDGSNTYIAKNFIVHNCDGPLFRDKTVAVVGGGDSAIKSALLLSQYAQNVYLVVRGNELSGEPMNIENVKKNKKVEIIYGVEVSEIKGKDKVESLLLNNGQELKVDGVFVEIGATPASALIKDLKIETDERGYIKVDETQRTNLKFVYAAGDVCTGMGGFKQVLTASAQGAVAATSAYRDLK